MHSPPSPNPTAIFKWEDSSSLEHSCWACPTKANSPKAVHSCYGIHSVPCLAYHSTMHAIGGSHRCSACTTTREMHDSRHREIAELVVEYHSLNEALASSDRSRVLVERSHNISTTSIPHHLAQRSDNDEIDEENLSVTDTASTATSGDTNTSKLSKAEQTALKRAKKASASQSKAAKNQARHPLNVTSEDIQGVNDILHGDDETDPTTTHPLATDRSIEDVIARNLGFTKQITSHKKALLRSVKIGRKEDKERKQAKHRLSLGLDEEPTEAAVNAVLKRFDIRIDTKPSTSKNTKTIKNSNSSSPKKKFSTSSSSSSSKSSTNFSGVGGNGPEARRTTRSQAAIVQKLREAIKQDFEKHENDLHQRYVRAGGFFRYAGRTVFERMTDIAKTIDMQTGEEWVKKRKREALVLGFANAAVTGADGGHEVEDNDDGIEDMEERGYYDYDDDDGENDDYGDENENLHQNSGV